MGARMLHVSPERLQAVQEGLKEMSVAYLRSSSYSQTPRKANNQEHISPRHDASRTRNTIPQSIRVAVSFSPS